MWSEHCSYKNSIKWLKTLPRDGGRMLVAAGEENAGLMDMGGGFGVEGKNEHAPAASRSKDTGTRWRKEQD
jgi:phosphoribosylformylglycinamidine synthase